MIFPKPPINVLSQVKKFFYFFAACFLVFFFGFNLISVSKFLNNEVKTFLNPRPAAPSASVWPTATGVLSSASPTAIPNFIYTAKEDGLEIPKLNLLAPLVFSASSEIEQMTQDLKSGVAVYPGSDDFGNNGQIIILGHSAPIGWPKIRYEWVFSRLGDLAVGDEILINLQRRQYRYLMTRKIFLERGEEIPLPDSQNQEQFLYLVTCWPPGRDLRRLAIETKLSLTP